MYYFLRDLLTTTSLKDTSLILCLAAVSLFFSLISSIITRHFKECILAALSRSSCAFAALSQTTKDICAANNFIFA